MAIILPSGFNILNNEPVDARITLADETTRYALSSANVYEGLIVFQQDSNAIWVLTDTSNVGNSNGWTQLQIGSVSSNLPSGVVSSSQQILDYDIFATTGSNTFVGNQIISGGLDLSGSITNINSIKFNQTAGVSVVEGQMAWNNSDGTLDIGLNYGDVVLQVGQEQHFVVRNATGTTISNGTAVYASGLSVGSKRIEVSPFTANGTTDEVRFLGLATHNISDGVNGVVTNFGYVRGLDTRGTSVTAISVGDETWAEGDILYAHPTVAGKLTKVAPKDKITVAMVTTRHQTTGVLFVRPSSFGHIDDLHDVQINTGSLVTGSILEWNGDYFVNNTASLDSTYEEKASGTHTLVSGSDQLTGSLVDLVSDQTISGTKTFNDIIVNGTGSFAYIESVTGSAKIIGDAFIQLNNNTPAERYAGIVIIDSGSNPASASFYFDGQTNDWGYEYSSSAGIDYAVTLFGPEYATKGTPTYLTSNRIPKAVDNHHLNDSNISDSGTLITLNSNSQVNGNLVVNGTVSASNLISGSSQVSYPALSNIPAGIVSGSSQVNADSITNFDTNVKDKLNADTVVSGSSQITKTLQEVTTAGNTTSTSISITNNTASTSKTTGALVVTGGIGTSGDIFAGGDVVAYASSDIRLKDNVELISNPLQKINQIGGYSFVWNEEKQNIYKGTDYGVIAQEIEQILPELVDTRENGYKAVKYDKLVSLLIEGIKDLSKQVEELKEKINNH
jgi:hypothetical protein